MLQFINFNKPVVSERTMRLEISMIKKQFFLFAFAVTITSTSPIFASEKKGLPENQFQEFLTQSKIAPGNLSKDQELIRKLSIPQLHAMVDSFKLGNYGFLHPMRIKGKALPSLLGRKFSDLSVMAVWAGELKPIPFQFDEFDKENHYIYIPDINRSPIDGTYLELDAGDELIFLYRDAGETRYNEKSTLKQGKILKEIEIKDRRGNTRYAYVVENSPERSSVDYIDMDLKKSKVISSYYHIEYDSKNFLNFKDARPYVGTAADQRVIDNIYFELSANIFSKLVKVGLNSAQNVRITVLGVKDGPVRSTAFIKITIIFGKIPIFSMNSEISFYEQGMVMPNRTEVGKGAMFVNLFKNAEMIMYADVNALDRGKISAQTFIDKNGKRLYGVIDGKMDAEEIQAMAAGLPGDWTWIESGKGWDIFMAFELPMEQLEGMTVKVYYLDDKNVTTDFETFPGAARFGMILNGLPNDMKAIEQLEMEYAFLFPDRVGEKGPEAFYQEWRNPPTTNILDIK
jgi:hypothetical protein